MAATSRGPVFSRFQRIAVVLLTGGLTIGGLALAGKPTGGGGGGGKAKPAISVSATSLGFGEVNVGATSSSQSVSVKNTGSASLTFTSSGIPASPWSLSDRL